jgi:hypothetical protein
MTKRRFWIAASLITLASIAMIAVAVSSLPTASAAWWTLLAAVAIGQSSLFWLWPREGEVDAEVIALRAKISSEQQQLTVQQEEFDRIRLALQSDMGFREERLQERERDLASRFARFHEFLEYPVEDIHAKKSSGELQKLTEQDRSVRKLLETEAERVYEKIRRNGYTVKGKVDLETTRIEAMNLIQQVAKIYNPSSQNPLLETSFEQLARAASRICLHVLVLLEQLPVSVQHYNANKLYGYMQKAIISYGVYQKASPWLTYLSRGLYAGRIAAATNPAAIGAWWLATELGKRGAQKVIENVVDRQAIATLHDLVTVIGVEVAGIYGTGFRQRDTGWILGAELVELIHSFPMSGESLRNGLRHVTALPLRSEYDRIYLYRCLADHKSAGLQLADPAMLPREEREVVAKHLEAFFTSHIHGATEANLKKWRDGFEQRFDLRLTLDGIRKSKSDSEQNELQLALHSLASFLQSVAGVSVTGAIHAMADLKTSLRLADSERSAIIAEVCRATANQAFEPPTLDPAAPITNDFLSDLATCCTISEHPDEQVEQLACEVSRYFRRPAQDMQNSLDAAWQFRAKLQSSNPTACEHLNGKVARGFFELRNENEQLAFCYGDLSQISGDAAEPLPDTWLLGLELTNPSGRRVIAIECSRGPRILWESACPLKTSRTKGLFLDDARISGGKWTEAAVTGAQTSELAVSGSLRGGRFRTYFKDLLTYSEPLQ